MASGGVGVAVAMRLNKVAAELRGASPKAVEAGARLLKESALREVKKAVGGDQRMSGVGTKGARVGVRYDLKHLSVHPKAIIKATGPLHLVERPTKAHDIAPKRRRRGGPKAKALAFGGGQFYARVRHPGTSGKRPFERGIERAKDKAIKALRDENISALRRGFRK